MGWGIRRPAAARARAPCSLLPGPCRRPAVGVLAACAAAMVVLGLLFAGQKHAGWLDAAVDDRIQSGLDRYPVVLRFLFQAGHPIPVSLMTAVLVLACAMTRRWSGAVLAAVAVPAASALTEFALKPLVGRTMLGALSLPSGEATGVFALATACAVLLVNPPGHRVPGPVRLLLAVAAGLAASAVAVAMVAQAAHYFTDTVAGAAIGIGVVLGCALTLDALASRPPREPAAPPVPGG
jgi:membrane-associated phospholipid phosphatase